VKRLLGNSIFLKVFRQQILTRKFINNPSKENLSELAKSPSIYAIVRTSCRGIERSTNFLYELHARVTHTSSHKYRALFITLVPNTHIVKRNKFSDLNELSKRATFIPLIVYCVGCLVFQKCPHVHLTIVLSYHVDANSIARIVTQTIVGKRTNAKYIVCVAHTLWHCVHASVAYMKTQAHLENFLMLKLGEDHETHYLTEIGQSYIPVKWETQSYVGPNRQTQALIIGKDMRFTPGYKRRYLS